MDGKTNESELLQASAAGDKEAFGLVVQRYQSLICALTYSATGDVATSEDLAQETFIRAWKKLRQLESPGKFRAWLCTIARNLTHSAARRRSVTSPLEEAQTQPANTPGPDEVALARERRQIVWDAVGRIEPKYREPLILYYRCGQSIREVADNLDLSEDAVRQRLHRGRQFIKTEVSSLVEDALVRSGPGKVFAVAVVAALPAMVTAPAGAAVVVAAKGTPVAKALAGTGLLGVILGPILGLPGGLLGAWLCTRPDTPRQQQFLRRQAVIWCLLFLVTICLPGVLVVTKLTPVWVLGLGVALFLVFQLPWVLWTKASQKRIQRAEGGPSARITRQGLHAAFGGAILGGCSGFLYQAVVAKDWVAFGAILISAAIVFFVATEVYRRKVRQ